MSGSDRETLPEVRDPIPDVQKWTGDPLGCPGVLGRPSWMCVSGGRPSRMTGSVREALPDILEPYRMYGSDREVLPDVREWSRGYPDCPGVVRRLSEMSGSNREAHPDVREWS